MTAPHRTTYYSTYKTRKPRWLMHANSSPEFLPVKLFTRAEVLSRPSPVPLASGLYAWFFKEMPPGVPVDGCLVVEGFTLLYIGIAPDGQNKPNSRATLRSRIRQHLSGNAVHVAADAWSPPRGA
jgi:hypothetical protein